MKERLCILTKEEALVEYDSFTKAVLVNHSTMLSNAAQASIMHGQKNTHRETYAQQVVAKNDKPVTNAIPNPVVWIIRTNLPISR